MACHPEPAMASHDMHALPVHSLDSCSHPCRPSRSCPPSRRGSVHSYSILRWCPTVSATAFGGPFSLEPVSAGQSFTHSM
ncbi:hypothetical protein CCUS01_08709 [Colletotrichum cuscutae]|uniref:Uncharacterized protein n=1 Tax=Colletotrichum cuscutae TaxID=1209917 RepID=A0AAI9XUH0_9PEZI|nr:hypothetical protein CCUS01_08709 [Colletotrichum cuscutae]